MYICVLVLLSGRLWVGYNPILHTYHMWPAHLRIKPYFGRLLFSPTTAARRVCSAGAFRTRPVERDIRAIIRKQIYAGYGLDSRLMSVGDCPDIGKQMSGGSPRRISQDIQRQRPATSRRYIRRFSGRAMREIWAQLSYRGQ